MSTRRKLVLAGLGVLVLAGTIYWFQRRRGGLGKVRRILDRHPEAPAIDGASADGMKTTLRASDDMSIEQRVASIQRLVYESIKDPGMRRIALQITNKCPPRDDMCELRAIYDFTRKNIRYAGDVGPIRLPSGEKDGIDLYQSARRSIEMGAGDCLPINTLVLKSDYEMVPIVSLEPGDEIFDGRAWTRVHDVWVTDVKPILEFSLSNGCILGCSPEHRIFRDVDGRVEEIRASEARIGDDLVMGESIPLAIESSIAWPKSLVQLPKTDLAWLLGVYVADGWAEEYRAAISGADGHVKEEQKRRVEQLMAQAEIGTRWHRKYISLNDSALARFLATSGSPARNKRVPNLSFVSELEVRSLLSGLAADADLRNGVFGTTSETLALQLRVLHRMLGVSVHITRVDDHGGFGKHPIFRVTPRSTDNPRRDIRFARIRSIAEGDPELCADITTDAGRFWLPESDTVVHNCDDHSILNASLAALNGFEPRLRVMKESAGDDWSHIYAGALTPRNGGGKFIALDTTLPGNRFDVEPPSAEIIEFDA